MSDAKKVKQKVTIAFDVDDTLVIPACALEGVYPKGIYPMGVPNQAVASLLFLLKELGCRTVIWSRSGELRAKKIAKKFNFQADVVCAKTKENAKAYGVDITFDDQVIDLGTVNIKVPRFRNHISRKEKMKSKQ